MDLENMIGYTLGEAKKLLNTIGVDYTIIHTKPPRDEYLEPEDSFRVIKIKRLNTKEVELLVCKPL